MKKGSRRAEARVRNREREARLRTCELLKNVAARAPLDASRARRAVVRRRRRRRRRRVHDAARSARERVLELGELRLLLAHGVLDGGDLRAQGDCG
jgi:hypothetical protein